MGSRIASSRPHLGSSTATAQDEHISRLLKGDFPHTAALSPASRCALQRQSLVGPGIEFGHGRVRNALGTRTLLMQRRGSWAITGVEKTRKQWLRRLVDHARAIDKHVNVSKVCVMRHGLTPVSTRGLRRRRRAAADDAAGASYHSTVVSADGAGTKILSVRSMQGKFSTLPSAVQAPCRNGHGRRAWLQIRRLQSSTPAFSRAPPSDASCVKRRMASINFSPVWPAIRRLYVSPLPASLRRRSPAALQPRSLSSFANRSPHHQSTPALCAGSTSSPDL